MTYELKRLDLLSVFKISFFVYLVIGFLLGILYSLVLLKLIAAFGTMFEGEMFREVGQIGFIGALALSLFMAFLMAVIWSIITVIAAGIYNLFSGMIGGMRLELGEMASLYAPPEPPRTSMNPPDEGTKG